MTTAADELRAAAARMRTLATAASIGPKGEVTTNWAVQYRINEFTREEERDRGARLYASGDTAETGPRTPIFRGPSGGYGGRGPGPSMPTQFAEYVAAMDPTVGLLLAELLETAAEYVASVDEDAVAHPTHLVRAFAIAQAINTGSRP